MDEDIKTLARLHSALSDLKLLSQEESELDMSIILFIEKELGKNISVRRELIRVYFFCVSLFFCHCFFDSFLTDFPLYLSICLSVCLSSDLCRCLTRTRDFLGITRQQFDVRSYGLCAVT